MACLYFNLKSVNSEQIPDAFIGMTPIETDYTFLWQNFIPYPVFFKSNLQKVTEIG